MNTTNLILSYSDYYLIAAVAAVSLVILIGLFIYASFAFLWGENQVEQSEQSPCFPEKASES